MEVDGSLFYLRVLFSPTHTHTKTKTTTRTKHNHNSIYHDPRATARQLLEEESLPEDDQQQSQAQTTPAPSASAAAALPTLREGMSGSDGDAEAGGAASLLSSPSTGGGTAPFSAGVTRGVLKQGSSGAGTDQGSLSTVTRRWEEDGGEGGDEEEEEEERQR